MRTNDLSKACHKNQSASKDSSKASHKNQAASCLNAQITFEEVQQAIKQLQSNKACGIDKIKAEFLIHGIEHVTEPITKVFNAIFRSEFPADWSVGLITPNSKRGTSKTVTTIEV